MPTMTSITSGMNTTYDQYDVQNIIIQYFCILTTFFTMNYNDLSTFPILNEGQHIIFHSIKVNIFVFMFQL